MNARQPVVDLRQYTLKPGRRDVLIDLFDGHFVAGQESCGIQVIGQFRDLDDPDRFVWLRGFDDLPARQSALESFYYGPIWQEHRESANDTMLDSDNALLLKPLWTGQDYPALGSDRRRNPGGEPPSSVIGITVLGATVPIESDTTDAVLNLAVPELEATGGTPVAVFVTDPSENNFPALALRADHVLAWVCRFDSDAAYADHMIRRDQSARWKHDVLPALRRTTTLLQQLRLRPTVCSQLR